MIHIIQIMYKGLKFVAAYILEKTKSANTPLVSSKY